MRTFMIAAIIAGLAVPAHAQMGHGKGGGKLGQKSDEQTTGERQQKKNEEKNASARPLSASKAGTMSSPRWISAVMTSTPSVRAAASTSRISSTTAGPPTLAKIANRRRPV